MTEQVSGAAAKFEIEQLGKRDALREIVKATAVVVGLTLLWGLERLRNTFFGLLDRLNLKAWARKGSAFPPGSPRKLKS